MALGMQTSCEVAGNDKPPSNATRGETAALRATVSPELHDYYASYFQPAADR